MQLKRHSRAARRKGERGNVLAYTVLSALFLFLAVGLGVDLSHLYLAKTELQNAADAAALAGASALTLPENIRITSAVDRAVNTMNLNKYNFNNRTFGGVMSTTAQRNLVMFAVELDGPYLNATDAADPVTVKSIRFVRVTTPTVPVNMIFSIPIMGTTQNLSGKAVAGMSRPGNVKYCPFPLSVVQCGPTNSSCLFDPTFWGDCGDPPIPGTSPAKPPRHVYSDGSPSCDPTKEFCRECTYTVRAASGSGGPSPGNYGILGCAGSGASEVRDALAAYGVECKCGLTNVGDFIAVKTGINAGPISQGLNVRFDQYKGPTGYSTLTPPDLNIAEGVSSKSGFSGISFAQYQAGSPNTPPSADHVGVADRRILVLPITYAEDWPTGSSGSVKARGFGAFFMRSEADQNSGDIRLEFISKTVGGVTGYDPTAGDSNSNIVTPVLYR